MEKVIFDTNAYRYLATNKSRKEIDAIITKVNNREKKNEIESLISPIVAKELLAHVSDKNDPSYEKCLNAIQALYYHSGSKEEFHMIPSPELLISKAYFKKEIESKIETNQALGQMLYHLGTNPSDYVFRKFQHSLNAIARHVKEAENAFAEQMELFLKKIDPEYNNWEVFNEAPEKRKKALEQVRSEGASIGIAMGYLYMTYLELEKENKVSSKNEKELLTFLRPMAVDFIKVFPEPIQLYKLVMENLINSKFNLYENSRSNFVWDINLMFNVGQNRIENSRIIFVTSDKAIIENALKSNSNNLVLTFEEYMSYLGLI